MEIDKVLINEIKSFANKTGAYCVVNGASEGEVLYELNPVGHISFVYDKNNDNKPTCFLFSMVQEHTGGALRRIVLTGVERHAEGSYLLYGYMGGDEIPVSSLIIGLEENDEALEKTKWAEWNNRKSRSPYPDEWPDWKQM